MLHKLNPVDSNVRIVRLTQIVSTLIEFLCHPKNPFCEAEPDDLKNRILAICPDPLMAKWLGNPQGKTLKQKVTAVVEFLAEHPDATQQLSLAFQHDIQYQQHLDDTDFVFAFSQLDPALQAHIQALMLYLYENLGQDGYPMVVMGDGRRFSRGDYLNLWEEQNASLNVCPACDGKKPDKGRKKHRLSDLDHFLPKSVYPFLALHPRNLVPICMECNERIKGDIDPLEEGGAVSISHSFHPYSPQAAHENIDVICQRDPNGVPEFTIKDRSAGSQSVRVRSLDRVFALGIRWTGRTPEVNASLLDKISGWTNNFVFKYIPSDQRRDALRDALQADRDGAKIGSEPNRILYQSYLTYVLSNPVEFDQLLSSVGI